MKLAPFFLATLVALPLAQQEGRELQYEQGTVQVDNDLATMQLPDQWNYLQASDARYVLEDLFGNPPDKTVVGMASPPSEVEGEFPTWFVVVSVQNDGHVDDEDAASIDYSELLEGMQESADAHADELEAQGYESARILGWAEAPHYDSAEKKLYWAKRIQFSQTEGETLNYDVRVLGREGVLILTAVADPVQLSEVSNGCKELLAGTAFVEGKRYEDYDPSTDRLAAYGIGGLIAGKVLGKVGLFAKLAKFGKFIVVGVVAGFVFLKKKLSGK